MGGWGEGHERMEGMKSQIENVGTDGMVEKEAGRGGWIEIVDCKRMGGEQADERGEGD